MFCFQQLLKQKRLNDPDLGDTYYLHWLSALEKMAAEKGLVEAAGLLRRKEEWDAAARATPHGQPIVLKRDKGE